MFASFIDKKKKMKFRQSSAETIRGQHTRNPLYQ